MKHFTLTLTLTLAVIVMCLFVGCTALYLPPAPQGYILEEPESVPDTVKKLVVVAFKAEAKAWEALANTYDRDAEGNRLEWVPGPNRNNARKARDIAQKARQRAFKMPSDEEAQDIIKGQGFGSYGANFPRDDGYDWHMNYTNWGDATVPYKLRQHASQARKNVSNILETATFYSDQVSLHRRTASQARQDAAIARENAAEKVDNQDAKIWERRVVIQETYAVRQEEAMAESERQVIRHKAFAATYETIGELFETAAEAWEAVAAESKK